jgi:hypothetical protein
MTMITMGHESERGWMVMGSTGEGEWERKGYRGLKSIEVCYMFVFGDSIMNAVFKTLFEKGEGGGMGIKGRGEHFQNTLYTCMESSQ